MECIEKNAKHYLELLSAAVDKVMPKERSEISYVVKLRGYNVPA